VLGAHAQGDSIVTHSARIGPALIFDDLLRGRSGETLGERGHSKDHRPDLKQMVVGVVLDPTAIRSAANSGRATRPT